MKKINTQCDQVLGGRLLECSNHSLVYYPVVDNST